MESFEKQFAAFSKFGDSKSNGTTITLSQSDKWMKQANVFGKKVTTTDTAIHFRKLKSMKLNLSDYNAFISDLAKAKDIDSNELKNQMIACGAPRFTKTKTVSIFSRKKSMNKSNKEWSSQNAKAEANVERLTNTKNYTGTHKERFDATGKGIGITRETV